MQVQRFRIAAVSVTVLLLAGLFALKSKSAAQTLPAAGSVIGPGPSLVVQPVAATRIRDEFVYSVPFLCGTTLPTGSVAALTDRAVDTPPLVPGTYITTIRVHNPDDQATVRFVERAAEVQLQRQARGRISPALTFDLAPEQALEVDCGELFRLFGSLPPATFVVIRSPAPLDVSAIYSADSVVAATAR